MEPFTEFICFKLGSATRRIQKYYNNRLSEYGITIAQSFIILSLLERNGQNIKELAEKLGIDSSAITGLVDRLEKEDLVERRVDRNDRRAFHVNVTPKGKKLGESILPIAIDFNERLKSSLTKSEQSALSKFFKKVEDIES